MINIEGVEDARSDKGKPAENEGKRSIGVRSPTNIDKRKIDKAAGTRVRKIQEKKRFRDKTGLVLKMVSEG